VAPDTDDAIGRGIARIGPGRLARAITAPSGILTFGVVTAAAILGLGVSAGALAGAGVLGTVAWLGGTAWRIGRASRQADRNGGRNGAGPRIDPFAVGEPWRRFVTSVLRQQSRYREVVAGTQAGPIRDRLASIGDRVDEVVRDVWEVAQRGNTLHDALRRLDLRSLERELADTERELATAGPDRRAVLTELVETRRASLAVAQRLASSTQSALDRLRALDADLERLVVNAVEVSATTSTSSDLDQLDELDRQFDTMVDELEGLRLALDETQSVERGATGAPGPTAAGGTPLPGSMPGSMPG
jgi:hypothetical protein